MVVVPAGSFAMGTSHEEMAALTPTNDTEYLKSREYEGPKHPVTIARPFAVGRFVVTFEEWAWAQAHPDWRKHSGLKPRQPNDWNWGQGRRPVIDVSWDGAQAYCRWLKAVTGKPYRLPSEAEWEYCCRAGTTTAYSTGDAIMKEQAQFRAEKTVEVGTFPANAWGLHDLHGNVWEWCHDEWHGNYEVAPDDGSARQIHEKGSRRVLRGGSWNHIPWYLRSANRFRSAADSQGSIIGFRVARTLSARAGAITVAPGEH
jgi:formylglycine-generating enzyme required for sulfatase activity